MLLEVSCTYRSVLAIWEFPFTQLIATEEQMSWNKMEHNLLQLQNAASSLDKLVFLDHKVKTVKSLMYSSFLSTAEYSMA